ncbi:biorientation of chromosomes in cell division protein 1-like 1 isoform X2 [Homalodisca vitripennis]|uniref:biorientation of chromosomes in cell division protein 1-like 1 isoform X2 n=1 Tax=Homalodisca vitripennis TaxID=197043 RepID=UPI001EEB53AC|nr:biorientation of chromosomes in cell division protein 1-like 1 isoform X2 [Homalodisca vitripennis]
MTTPTVIESFDRPADPVLTNKIVTHLKSQGIFDQFRRECMADVDTKPAYQNLRQRVEGSVAAFLKMNPWRPDMNKNQLRDNLRKHIQSGGFLDIGVDRIVDQVVNPKIYTVFLPKVEEVVHNCLGMDKGKPVFEPPPTPEVKNEPPPRFQNKHNLAPRARIPAPLSGPRFPPVPNSESMKPPEPLEDKEPPEEGKVQSGSPEQEETTNRNYVVDLTGLLRARYIWEDDNEENPDEDDEESPPFEPHSESDRLILGVRTDSSDSISNDSQVVTTIVDDNLEDRIDSSGTAIKEEGGDKEVKKEDEYSSDEYVPKTPTINMEGSDGTVIEFNSISEYKQYQTKYDEESLQNVEEEVVSSQWLDDSSNPMKEERNSAEEESESVSLKRKLNIDHFDEASSSSIGKGSTSDEGKSNTYLNFVHKKMKVEEDDQDYETASEFNLNENEDSNPEKSKYMADFNMKILDSEQREKYKKSDGSKESGKNHRRHHGTKDHRSSSHHNTSSKDKLSEKEYRESSSSSTHSSKDKKDHHKRDEKHSQSRDRSKEKERKKSESSTTKHSDRDRHDDKDKEKNIDKRKVLKSETNNKDQDLAEKDKKESRNEHRDKSRDHNEKEKRKHDNHDKHSDGKQDHDSSHRHDKDKRDSVKSSKHSHNSSRHNHKSSERYKSDKDQKLRQPSDKHTSHDKKSEKHDSRKKTREHCKPSNRDNEGRRSTDRDSNGPSGRSQSSSHSSSTSRSATSRSRNESTTGNGDRTTSNSDNAVSDNIETLFDEDVISEPGIASPDPEPYEDCWSEISASEFYDSKEEMMESSFESNEKNSQNVEEISEIQRIRIENSHPETTDGCDVNHTFDQSQTELNESHKKEHFHDYDKCDNITDDVLKNLEENICVEKDDMEESFTNPTCSVHDTSSEKENIEQTVNYKEARNSINDLSKNIDQKEAKFKKPKIAANIFEVKKIMQARRNLKRMEKKRLKLLTNNNPDICITEKTAYGDCTEKPPDETFTGFENVTSYKTEMYDCLIKRLSDEIDLLTVKEEINPNLITSLIEVKPELDEYIEKVLRGKVHRKLRVRLPAISHEYYTFDIEQNAYILTKCREYSPTPHKELIDGNLNNLNKVSQNYKHCITSSESEFNHAIDTFNGSRPKLKCNAIQKNSISKPVIHDVNESGIIVEEEDNSPESSSVSDVSSEEESNSLNSLETGMVNAKMNSTHDNVTTSKSVAPAFEDPPLPKIGGFVLTFNQTYDEILKEREQTSMKTIEAKPTPRTVVKITNSDTTEKVVMKKASTNLQNKSQVPRITKSETVMNGVSAKSTPEGKLPPLISRIKKCNNGLSPPSTKPVNGIISVDDVCKIDKTHKIPKQQINDVIGITATVIKDQDNQRNPLEADCEDQRHLKDTKQAGSRVQQRYNSSDLYKPRLQLSRRGRGKSSGDTAISQTIITRKRPSVTTEESSRPKRKR